MHVYRILYKIPISELSKTYLYQSLVISGYTQVPLELDFTSEGWNFLNELNI